MGKSPGRWIKTVLFGKKHSKSGFSKNAKYDKKDGAKNPVQYLSGSSPVISNPHVITDESTENIEPENATAHIPCGSGTSIPKNQGVESQHVSVSLPINDAEMKRQGEAAAKVQAAFRGYLARRAFWALKGIIRLQAVIRGHLVRRQAVATLRCMQAVVKLQALARGQRVRLSRTWPELYRKHRIEELQDARQVNVGKKLWFMSEKQATNAYIRKLLLSLPTAMPLSLQYNLAEPNSAWNWLERWSLSRFWKPPPRPRKISSVKPLKKLGTSQTVDNDSWKSKRTFKKASAAVNGDNGVLASIELDKPKRNLRKIINHPTEPVLEQQPQNEFERVKRNLRKVSAPVPAASERLKMETDKPIMNSAPLNVSEKESAISAETLPISDIVEKQALVEAPTETSPIDQQMNVLHDYPLVDSHTLENVIEAEITPHTNEEIGIREDESGKENQKVRKRRSLPAKQEYTENISQNTPTLPSYMAATESAKAKLRAQGSARFSEDGMELGYIRRHSLPASTNGKLSSMSPRMEKPPQANSKVGSKTNRSMLSLRDEKVLQPGWRR